MLQRIVSRMRGLVQLAEDRMTTQHELQQRQPVSVVNRNPREISATWPALRDLAPTRHTA
jgi:hypothetical protein